MKTLKVKEITKSIKEMCIEANHFLSEDMQCALRKAVESEEAPLGLSGYLLSQDNSFCRRFIRKFKKVNGMLFRQYQSMN